jgi:hypothetical protein
MYIYVISVSHGEKRNYELIFDNNQWQRGQLSMYVGT